MAQERGQSKQRIDLVITQATEEQCSAQPRLDDEELAAAVQRRT